MNVPLVVITVRGGVVQHVASNTPINVAVIDYDNDTSESDPLFIGEPDIVQDPLYPLYEDKKDPTIQKRIKNFEQY